MISFTWNVFLDDETMFILFETSFFVSKRYNWAYSGRASGVGMRDPIR
jgi:hypothetical protein